MSRHGRMACIGTLWNISRLTASKAWFTFSGSTPTQKEDTFLLEGLQPGSQYQVDFEDHPSENRRVSGHELMRRGLAVSLPEPESSELVFITEIRSH